MNVQNSYDSPQYDTDGSGEIEFPEFCNMMSNKMNQSDDAEMVKIMMMPIYNDDGNDKHYEQQDEPAR